MQDKGPSPDLKSLLQEARKGSSTARGLLIERYYAWIVSAIRLQVDKRFRLKESCEDMAQAICMQVLAHLDDFEYRGEDSFRCWLYAWIKNIVRNRRRYYTACKRDGRKEIGHVELDRVSDQDLLNCYSTIMTPSQTAIVHEDIHRIEAAMDRLPWHYREVITQAQLLGLPHTEITRRSGRSPEATRVLLHRAMGRLKEILIKSDRSSA